jgi:hypothetical protein
MEKGRVSVNCVMINSFYSHQLVFFSFSGDFSKEKVNMHLTATRISRCNEQFQLLSLTFCDIFLISFC